MKRVLFVNHLGILGGAELALLDVARHYRATSTVLLLADGPLRDRLADAGVRVLVYPAAWATAGRRARTTPPSARSIAEVARTTVHVARLARDHDLLLANSQKASIVASGAVLLTRRPLVIWLHEILSREHFSRWNVRLNVALMNRRADRVVATSAAAAAEFRAQGGDRDKIRIIYGGFDWARYADADAGAIEAARARLGLSPGPVVGLFGRVTPWKGHDVLLEALGRLPDVTLLIAGEAMIGDEGYLRDLERRVAALGLTHRVHFLGFRRDVPQLLQLVDIVLHTSMVAEPFGRVIVEGMLAGRPVIATRGGGVEEIVTDGATGLLVPPGRPDALAAAIRRLLDDAGLARRVAAAGRAHARARWPLERMLHEFDRLIEDVAGGHRPPRAALRLRREPLVPGPGSWEPR